MDAADAIRERLGRSKPGWASQLKMAPVPRPGQKPYQEAEGSCLRAGILVLLYPRRGRLHLVLTRRTEGVAHHQAQISFPGGQMDEGESGVDAALRETEEELGVDPSSLEVVGELTPLYVPPSNFCINPVVATAPRRPPFRRSPHEVEEVIEIPVEHLLNPKNKAAEKREIRGLEVTVPYYRFRGNKIWGATAMVLAELLDIIR